MFNVSMYTDGSCFRNGSETAIGGYCAILTFGTHERIIHGYESRTTNNRMELRAIIEGVKALKAPSSITVYTDSMYVVKGAASLRSWLKDSRPHANMDLWQELIDAGKQGKHHLSFQHVPGHSGNPMNERCDKIARNQSLQGSIFNMCS